MQNTAQCHFISVNSCRGYVNRMMVICTENEIDKVGSNPSRGFYIQFPLHLFSNPVIEKNSWANWPC